MRFFLNRLRQILSSRLWVQPLLSGALGIALGIALTSVSISRETILAPFLWPGDSAAASSMIGFIASTTLTVLTTTISMTLIVLQVASGNFSQQLLRDFISSRAVRGILSVYVGLFSYCMMVSRSIGAKDSQQAPQLAMTAAMVGIFLAVATFIWYVSRVVDMVRVDSILDASAERVLRCARPNQASTKKKERSELMPEMMGGRVPRHRSAVMHAVSAAEPRPVIPDDAVPYHAKSFGYIQAIDVSYLGAWAKEHGACAVIDARPGDPVHGGQVIGWLWTRDGKPRDLEIPTVVYISSERISGQDFTLGLQQMLDMAVRALSPGINDPATANHAIYQASRVLSSLMADPVVPMVVYADDPSAKRAGAEAAPGTTGGTSVADSGVSSVAGTKAHSARSDEPDREVIVWAACRTVAEMIDTFTNGIRRYCAGHVSVMTNLLRFLDVVGRDVDDEMAARLDAHRLRILALATRDIVDPNDLAIVRDAAHCGRGCEVGTVESTDQEGREDAMFEA